MTDTLVMQSDRHGAEIELRHARINAVYFRWPEIDEALTEIHDLRLHGFNDRGEALIYLVMGPTWTGKSSLFSQYTDRHGENGVLRLRTPTLVDYKSLPGAFLEALGKRDFSRAHSTGTLSMRVVDALTEEGVKLVMLDDLQHVVDHTKIGAKRPYWAADWIKTYLLDTAKVPVACNGIDVVEEIFVRNTQLLSRRDGIKRLRPLDWRVDVDRERFVVAVDALEKAAGFRRGTGLSAPGPAERLHRASIGKMGNLKKLFRKATTIGVRAGADALDLDILAIAHAQLADAGPGWVNVISVPVLPPVETPDNSRVTRLHSKGVKR